MNKIFTLKQNIKLNKSQYKIFKDYSHYSNNLYNYALYICNQYFKETNKYIGLKTLEKQVKFNKNYKLLPAQNSQQLLRLVDKNYRSFFSLLRKKKLGQYNDNINVPKYKKKGSCFNIIFTGQNCNLKNNIILFPKSKLYKSINSSKLHLKFTYKINCTIKQIIIKPYNDGKFFKMFIQYEENKNNNINYDLKKENKLSIDLGINNLAACFSNVSGPFIINGKPLKSYNRYYNKTTSEIKSKLKKINNKNWSNKLSKINENRNNYIDNYFNQSVNKIIKYCLNNKIGEIIFGYNEGWKTNINIGKINNQKFIYIPYYLFKRKIESKCRQYNINFILTEESYTSKCSFLDNEELCKKEEYLGKRVKRGLYRSKEGILLNADVNGSANIMRKVIDNVYSNIDQSILDLMLNPFKFNI